jgi:hypothetical protein
MLFYGRRTTVQLALAKPLDFCCNCGRDAEVGLVETPLQQTRFFLVFGTELELRDEFPYCRVCRRSAGRVRPGTAARLLMACLTTSVLVLVIVMAESVLPRGMRESPFWWSLALGLVATSAYFAFRARRGTPRSYYPPVRLVDAQVAGGRLHRLRLEFANAAYCRLFARANAEWVAAGVLQVRAAARPREDRAA